MHTALSLLSVGRGGVFLSGGVSVWGGLCPGGLSRGGLLDRTPFAPVNIITDACENTTLPQLRCGR